MKKSIFVPTKAAQYIIILNAKKSDKGKIKNSAEAKNASISKRTTHKTKVAPATSHCQIGRAHV